MLTEKPRCVRCRRPYDTHIPDMDHPERGPAYCQFPPSRAEHYIPDHEHAGLLAELESRLTAEQAKDAEIAERDALIEKAANHVHELTVKNNTLRALLRDICGEADELDRNMMPAIREADTFLTGETK